MRRERWTGVRKRAATEAEEEAAVVEVGRVVVGVLAAAAEGEGAAEAVGGVRGIAGVRLDPAGVVVEEEEVAAAAAAAAAAATEIRSEVALRRKMCGSLQHVLRRGEMTG